MILKIKKRDLLKYLILIVVLSTTLCFVIKFLGQKGIIPWAVGYSDVVALEQKAFQPGTPYIDKPVEYPVIIGLVMYIAKSGGHFFYLFFHYFLFLGCAIITTIYLYRLCGDKNLDKTSLWLWAVAPSLAGFVYFNWDIIAVMFSVLALYYYNKNNKTCDIIATIFLALGFSTKIYPILFLFPILLHRRIYRGIKLVATFLSVFLLINLYFIVKSFSTWYFIYSFHTMRPPNVDSIWGLATKVFPSLTVNAINIITLIVFSIAYLIINVKFRKNDFIFLSFLSLTLFLIVNKVFSPQYLLWLLPFFALYGESVITFFALELSNIHVLFATLIGFFEHSAAAWFFSGVFVIARHILLIYVVFKKVNRVSKNLGNCCSCSKTHKRFHY